MQKLKIYFLFTFLFLFTLFTRFYNLNWGSPYYFHPDERNIASSVSQLRFPDQMNPHFFAYGSLPIYTIYFSGVAQNIFSLFPNIKHLFDSINSFTIADVSHVSFEQAILISRLYSAIFSSLLVFLLYLTGKKLWGEKMGLFLAFISSTSVGFIQFSHFGTFEMWITLFTFLLFFIFVTNRKKIKRNIFLSSLVFGILLSTKVSNIVLLPLPIIVLFYDLFFQTSHFSKKRKAVLFFTLLLSFLLFSTAMYASTNPFVLLDFSSFTASMKYESGVALGTLPVFYTGEFFGSTPIVFQFLYVFPFLINPFLMLLFPLAIFLASIQWVKKKDFSLLLIFLFFAITFLSQAFFFVKWIRYMVPTLPFMYLFIGNLFFSLPKITTPRKLLVAEIVICGVSFIFGVSYFITAFIRPDTRVEAFIFAKTHIKPDAVLLSEVYDLGIVPFNDVFHDNTLFNFYDLDSQSPDYNKDTLQIAVNRSDYFILPSQRILKVRLTKPAQFPFGYAFYNNIRHNKKKYKKVYETPCDIFCNITYLGNPAFRFEETANVFDRPQITIYQIQ